MNLTRNTMSTTFNRMRAHWLHAWISNLSCPESLHCGRSSPLCQGDAFLSFMLSDWLTATRHLIHLIGFVIDSWCFPWSSGEAPAIPPPAPPTHTLKPLVSILMPQLRLAYLASRPTASFHGHFYSKWLALREFRGWALPPYHLYRYIIR